MHPDSERLIELATQSLASHPPTRLVVEEDLRRHLEARTDIPAAALADAVGALACADARPWRSRWRGILYLATLLVSLPVLGHTAWQLYRFTGVRLWLWSNAESAAKSPDIPAGLKPREKLLLLGDTGAASEAARWKPLWDSDPDNPAYLSEYAAAYYKDHNQLSPEILAAAARIDPDNGWLPVLAAAGSMEAAVTLLPYTSKEKKAGKMQIWKIKDENRLREALAQIHLAAGKPKFTTYQAALYKQRISLLPRRTDFLSQLEPIVYMRSNSYAIIALLRIRHVLSADAQQCAARQDADGFRQITDDWMKLVQATTRSGETLLDLLVARALYTDSNLLTNFRVAAQSLGLVEEANRFAQLEERAKTDKEARKQSGRTSPVYELATQRGSYLTAMTLPVCSSQVANPPVITEADLRPGRYADHALFERAGSLFAWAMLGFCAGGAALVRFRHKPHVCSMSVRMLDLLRPADWAWLLSGGALLPLLWYFVITRLTPLGVREWSLKSTDCLQALGQFGSLVVLMVVCPVVMSIRILGTRGAVLGLAARRPWPGGLAVAAAAVGIPAFGAVIWQTNDRLLLYASLLLALAVLWLLVGFCRNIFCRRVHALRRATLARMVIPAWILGMLGFALAVPLHYAEERFWIQQDHLLEISAAAPALSRYEYDVTQILRAELLECIGQGGSSR
ncbi:MAG: hypothetical protein NTV46_09745 [Verrucomicrobia bacterium]|nr:hypothetical protein [Verrucomicrobiota bacterium]